MRPEVMANPHIFDLRVTYIEEHHRRAELTGPRLPHTFSQQPVGVDALGD